MRPKLVFRISYSVAKAIENFKNLHNITFEEAKESIEKLRFADDMLFDKARQETAKNAEAIVNNEAVFASLCDYIQSLGILPKDILDEEKVARVIPCDDGFGRAEKVHKNVQEILNAYEEELEEIKRLSSNFRKGEKDERKSKL